MSRAKEIRTKIGSIKSTQKITKAMEMVAASKMRKAQQAMERSRPYADKIRQMVGHIANASTEYQHCYMKPREVQRIGMIIISTDRGLCGGLNINLFKKAIEEMSSWQDQSVATDLCLFGSKAIGFFKRLGGNVLATKTHLGDSPEIKDLVGGVRTMLTAFEEGNIDRLYIVYNRFKNTMTQTPIVEQLLPLKPIDSESLGDFWDYIYEPNAEILLNGLLVRYIESQVYQSVLDTHACEQAARMVAMKSATDNAGNLMDELQLIYNNARQSAITQEISEIVGGASAV